MPCPKASKQGAEEDLESRLLRAEEENRKLLARLEKAKEENLRIEKERDTAKEERDIVKEERDIVKQERDVAQKEKAAAEIQLRPTSFLEFLEGCHKYLTVGYSSRIDYVHGTKGGPENATSKLRPDKIRQWKSFSDQQSAIWDELVRADFFLERHYVSLNTLKETGAQILLRKQMGSEMDLNIYESHAVDDHVAFIIKVLYTNPRLRKIFKLKGEVSFQNHGNTISAKDEGDAEGPETAIDLSQESPERKRQKGPADTEDDLLPVASAVRAKSRSRSSRPRADMFCVYNTGAQENIPAFIVEYKAPHKLTMKILDSGLVDMDVDDAVISVTEKEGEKRARQVVAMVITQAYSYMIQAQLAYGYICTGEAFIFLHVPRDDFKTVYYYPSFPEIDVATNTKSDILRRLHLTAVAQVLIFTLRALRTKPYGETWRHNAEISLERWELEDDYTLFSGDIDPDDQLPNRKQAWGNREEYIRSSPIVTRSKKTSASSCGEKDLPKNQEEEDDDDDDDDDSSGSGGFHPSSSPSAGLPNRAASSANIMVVVPGPPSSPPSQYQRKNYTCNAGPFYKWCTQKCLLGIRDRGPLDPACPNVAMHDRVRKNGNHAVDENDFRKLVRNQILHKSGPWGCESMHTHGKTAALFWLILHPYNYTLVAKAVPIDTIKRSIYEERLYHCLRGIHGVNVPVCLGSVDISTRPILYDGICRIVRLLLLSHAGKLIKFRAAENKDMKERKQLAISASESIHAIHEKRVLHCDAHRGNMFWNAENGRVMFIDFERAMLINETLAPAPAQGKKRKGGTISNTNSNEFERERKAIVAETMGL